MASKFTGRDYSTLREEIIYFLKNRLPSDWDSSNLADPIVVFAESLAKMGDQLHYTIDELRRECDISTAQRASSIYSYALREGYNMMLPKSSSGILYITSTDDMDGKLVLKKLSRFDAIPMKGSNIRMYVASDDTTEAGTLLHKQPNDVSITEAFRDYNAYVTAYYGRVKRVPVVLGTKGEYKFNYADINNDSTVSLPYAYIDRNLIKLTVTHADSSSEEWTYVNDVIGSGFYGNIYMITPKFIGGVISLCIEFPTSYTSLFKATDTFKFEYIKIYNQQIDNTDENQSRVDLTDFISAEASHINDEDLDLTGYKVELGEGIRGYTEFEKPEVTRANYKKYIQDYSALLTKQDYESFVKIATQAQCKVYDHSYNYTEGISASSTLPKNTELLPRVLYILTEAPYNIRRDLYYDLRERSSRSDCIVLVPYGVDPYVIFVKAECNLLGTSASEIRTAIKMVLINYYNGYLEDRPPQQSKIDFLAHSASDKILRVESCFARDTAYTEINVAADGTKTYVINSDFSDINNLSNGDVDTLFDAVKTNNVDVYLNDKYYLKGIYKNIVYDKYPYLKDNWFKDDDYFPFPDIYVTATNSDGTLCTEYESLVNYQNSYLTDSVTWDYTHVNIFDKENLVDYAVTADDSDFITSEFDINVDISSMMLKDHYVKHHYVVPYLSKVVVLIKTVDSI